MKKVIILFSIVASFYSTIWAQCPDLQATDYYSFSYSGHTYEIIRFNSTWAASCACAVSRNGYLVSIDNQDEQNAIWQAIVNPESGVETDYIQVLDGGSIAYIWIGASDINVESSWIWDGENDGSGIQFYEGQGANGDGGGSPIGDRYNNWGGSSSGTNNEPDNYVNIQDACAIGLSTWPSGGGSFVLGIAGEWNDISPTNSLYFIAEYDFLQSSIQNVPSYDLPYYSIADQSVKVDKSIKFFRLFDITGRNIVAGNVLNQRFQVSQTNGVYLVELFDNEGRTHTHKIYLP